MRNEFIDALTDLAERDERIVLMTGDLGFTVLEDFAERFPDRFYNVGVSEQNMLGMATGLAEAGLHPFAYSIATFASMRPFEFIRNGAVLHQLPVRIVGIGGGFDYGHNGASHFALEDIALMRVLPGMTVIAPADPDRARAALEATSELSGPVYLRLSKVSTPPLPGLSGEFGLGRAHAIGDGGDVAFVALGTMAAEALRAADLLAAQGIASRVIVPDTIKPAPREDLAEALGAVRVAVSAEAHFIDGGLGSLVAEVIAEEQLPCRLQRCGVRELPAGETGSQSYMLERHGLSAERLAAAAIGALEHADARTTLSDA
jgi:transketolase